MTLPSFFASIRARLAILILLAMLLLAGVLVSQEFRKHSADKRAADANLLRLATFAAHSERERFDAAQRLLVLASQAPSFRKVAATPNDKEAFDGCTTSLFVLDQLLPETSGFALWDTSGNVLCSSKGATRSIYNVRDRSWFLTATQTGQIATGAYELAPPDDEPSLGFGLPIRDDTSTNVIAYLSTGLKLDRPDDLLANGNLPDTGAIGLVDENGIIINSSTGQSGQTAGAGFQDRYGSLLSYPDALITDAARPGRRAAAVRITDAGDADVTLVLAADKDALVTPLAETLLKDLWPVALLTLAALAAIWLLADRWVMRPVRALAGASDALAAGELSARADVPPGVAEFEKLGASFNEMAAIRQRASEAKDEFLGLVSHELKTPMTMVLGNAAILRTRGNLLDAEQRQTALADIHDAGERLSAIIDNMLSLARLERGAGLENEPMLLRRVAESVSDSITRRGEGSVSVSGDETVLALGTVTYLEQVLRNLIGNALKYSPPGAPVEVTVGRDADMAVVRVLDRGGGVAPEEREAIFEAFYRSPRNPSHAAGVGIGLSVCKRLTEAMGGEIWCADRPGGGCEFGFSLPLVPIADVADVDEVERGDGLRLATT